MTDSRPGNDWVGLNCQPVTAMNDDLRGRLEGHADLLDQLGESKVQGHVNPATAKQIAQDIRDSLTEDTPESEQVVSEWCIKDFWYCAADGEILHVWGHDTSSEPTKIEYIGEQVSEYTRCVPFEAVTVTPEMRAAEGVSWYSIKSGELECPEYVHTGGSQIEYIPPRYSWLGIVPCTGRERRRASQHDSILRAHGHEPKD